MLGMTFFEQTQAAHPKPSICPRGPKAALRPPRTPVCLRRERLQTRGVIAAVPEPVRPTRATRFCASLPEDDRAPAGPRRPQWERFLCRTRAM